MPKRGHRVRSMARSVYAARRDEFPGQAEVGVVRPSSTYNRAIYFQRGHYAFT